MTQVLNTLYVTLPNAYLRLEGETVCVMVDKQKRLQVPLHHLGSIVCFGATGVSPALMARCAEDGRSLVFLSRSGKFHARLEGPVNGNILLRQAQFRGAGDPVVRLVVARACIAGKLRNSRQSLLRSARDATNGDERAALVRAARGLKGNLARLAEAADLDQVRGLEGDAARQYFQQLTFMLKPARRSGFGFHTRSRRPPRDPVNAVLSFLYALLLNDCRSALETVGLDPQLGFLHAPRPGRPALALDLMEELRPIIADRLAITLINRGQLDVDGFDTRPGESVILGDKGRRAVITAYQERKQDQVTHPVLEQIIPVGLIPQVQARLLARYLRNDAPAYVPFLYR